LAELITKRVTLRTSKALKAHEVKFVKAVQLTTFRDAIKAARAEGSMDDPVIIVDNSYTKPVINVKPGGRIRAIQRQDIGELAAEAYWLAVDLSPVGSQAHKPGRAAYRRFHYQDRFVVLINGKVVADDSNPPTRESIRVGPRDKVSLVNLQPYARRLEWGNANYRASGKGAARRYRSSRPEQSRRDPQGGVSARTAAWSTQAPNGILRVVYKVMQTRYGKLAFFKLRNLPLAVTGYRLTQAWGGIDQLYPTLIITPGAGTSGVIGRP